MPASPRGPTSPNKKSTASPPVSAVSPRKAGSPRKEQPSGEGRRSPRGAGQEKPKPNSAGQEQRKQAPAASGAQSPRSAGRTPAASGAQSPRSAGGSKVSANERSNRSKESPPVNTAEQEYWQDHQPVGGRVEAYGTDVCAKFAERHKMSAAERHRNAWHGPTLDDAPNKGPSSIASSRRGNRTVRTNPSELPRAGLCVKPRTVQPMVVLQFKNTLEFVPSPRGSNASVVSRVSTDGELSPSDFENIKHHVGERLHAKHTTVQKAFRTTGAIPNSFKFAKADLHNTFGAYGYSRKVSDRFFNTMDKDKNGVIAMKEFNNHFGAAIHPEYEQEKGGHGYMATTQRFFYDSKEEYDPPVIHHGYITSARH